MAVLADPGSAHAWPVEADDQGRRLDFDVETVRSYLPADGVEQLVAGGVRPSKLGPFKPNLHQRLNAGPRNATALHAEIVDQSDPAAIPSSSATSSRFAAATRPPSSRVLQNWPPPVRQVTA